MKKYASTIPQEKFAKYFIDANAKSAQTKVAKCFMKQEGVDHDTKPARTSSCLVETYSSSKKQQHSVVSLPVLLLWLYPTYDDGCTMRIICEHVVRVQYVRKYRDHLGTNMNMKPFIIIPDKLVHGKKIPATKRTARSFVSLHRQTWCSSNTMIHPHQIILQWAGSPQALLCTC